MTTNHTPELTEDEIEALESSIDGTPCKFCGRDNDWLYRTSSDTHHYFDCDDCNRGGAMIARTPGA